MKQSDTDFLSESMSFDIEWLEAQLMSQEIVNHKPLLEEFISVLICILGKDNPKKEIFAYFESTAATNKKDKLYEIIDSLRHAFTSYASGGLHDLYIYQSNESWYPKLVLKSELKPNDILNLPISFDIYRGCDISELKHSVFGQSWSTSFKVATEFAYQHYKSQPWYDEKNRCVLKATINRHDTFFSRQDHHEKEVAVNAEKLVNVQKT